MSRFFPVLTLFCALTGAILGWNAVPHYRQPVHSGETRLRQRAAQYYQASRLFDFEAMAQLFTPARQLAEKDTLLTETEDTLSVFSGLNEDNQASLRYSAESITPESVKLELEDDWALTWGECRYPTANTEVTVPLEQIVWVRSAGEWWIYSWTKPEIAAYGNPPDEAYEILKLRKVDNSRRVAMDRKQEQKQAAAVQTQPEVPAESSSNSEENNSGVKPDDTSEVNNGPSTD